MTMDELAWTKRVIRVYRNAIANILEEADRRPGFLASRIHDVVQEAQRDLDKLKRLAPVSIDPDAARERAGIERLEAFR